MQNCSYNRWFYTLWFEAVVCWAMLDTPVLPLLFSSALFRQYRGTLNSTFRGEVPFLSRMKEEGIIIKKHKMNSSFCGWCNSTNTICNDPDTQVWHPQHHSVKKTWRPLTTTRLVRCKTWLRSMPTTLIYPAQCPDRDLRPFGTACLIFVWVCPGIIWAR